MAIDNTTENIVPEFKDKLHLLFTDIRKAGLDCYIFESFRTQERQFELFGKWRTAATLKKYWVPVKYANPAARVVTWTLQSKHREWKAVDIVFDLNKNPKIKVPSWNGNYAKIIEIAKKYWIRNLAPAELCHFEI